MSLVLYSTNVFLKYHIQERFRGNSHYVWCSENFDSKTLPKYSAGSLVAPSSNPADIYKELKRDVDGRDLHSAKISAQRAQFKALAVSWESAGEITADQKDEIFYMADNAALDHWRPLIYVIPKAIVAAKLVEVHISKRASIGMEYIISDLSNTEFDLIEL